MISIPPAVIGWVVAGWPGTVLALSSVVLLGLLLALFARRIILRAFAASEVDPASHPVLHAVVARLAGEAGIETPRLAIARLRGPNAFAACLPFRRRGIVGVTGGLLEILSEAEIEAVLAHEIGHLAQYGRLIATAGALLAMLPGALCARAAGRLFYSASFRGSGSGPASLDSRIVAWCCAPPAALCLRLSVARSDEHVADRWAVRLTSAEALASALRKIDALAGRISEPVNPAVSHLLLVHPFSAPRLSRLLDTHPRVEERLSTLPLYARDR